MSVKLPKGKWMIIGTIILLILLFVGIYFFVLYPKIGLIDQKETELNMQQQLLATLESKIVETNENSIESTTTLQQLVPVKPLTEQLLLDIEKAETVSGSFVVSMSFADEEMTVEEGAVVEGGQANAGGEQGVETDAELKGMAKDSAEKVNGDEQAPAENSLPNGVKKVTVTMDIESPTYFELETFIRTLESSSRITVVEAIDFTANEEIIETEQVDKPLSYQVTLAAFYMPTLTDLLDELPKMESPEPAQKKNPFSNFGDFDQNKIVSSYIPKKEEIVKDGDNIIYTVMPGDTIYDISLRFYHSVEGIQKIRDINGIVGHLIFIGQKLIIPLEGSDTVEEK